MCNGCNYSYSKAEAHDDVQAAIELLDERKDVPADWRELIDLDTLNIDSVGDCILGQIFGNYNVCDTGGVRDEARRRECETAFMSTKTHDAWVAALS